MNDPRTKGGIPSEARNEGEAALREAKAGAHDLGREAKDRARDAVDDTKERTRSFFEEQKEVAADRVSSVADALRNTAHELEEDERSRRSASFAEDAAERLDRFATSLRERDLDGLIDETERFARRQPAVFLGATVATGFLVSRFLKSSSERRYAPHDDDPDEGAEDRGREPAMRGGERPYGAGASPSGSSTGASGAGSTGAGFGATPGGRFGTTPGVSPGTTPGVGTPGRMNTREEDPR